jgi:hypothetical protein
MPVTKSFLCMEEEQAKKSNLATLAVVVGVTCLISPTLPPWPPLQFLI